MEELHRNLNKQIDNSTHKKIVVLIPRRAGKTHFLRTYFLLHVEQHFYYIGLTKEMCDIFQDLVNVTTDTNLNPKKIENDHILCIDEPFYIRNIEKYCSMNKRILAIGTWPSPIDGGLHDMRPFIENQFLILRH